MAPKNAPMKIQMIMYPLKYIANNITKYATANCTMCSRARTVCSIGEGRNLSCSEHDRNGTGEVFVFAFVFVWEVVYGVLLAVLSLLLFSLLSGRQQDAGSAEVVVPAAAAAAAGEEAEEVFESESRYLARILALRTMNESYSRPRRRRNSRLMTSRMTPMQEPANMPLEVMCQEEERKPIIWFVVG